MSDLQRQQIRRRLGLEEYRALLGDAAGVVWDDPIRRPGVCRVRYVTAAGLSLPPLVQIGAYQGPTGPGTAVVIGWQDGELRVLRPNVSGQIAGGGNPAVNNAMLVAGSAKPATDNIIAFKSHPTSPISLNVVVRSWLYIESGTVKLFDASGDDGAGGFKGKIDLSSYVPTTGEHRLACLFLTPTNTIEIQASTTQSIIEPLDLTDVQECFDAATDTTKPCWAWRLADGQTAIGDESSWLDLRQFINIASSGGSGTVTSITAGTGLTGGTITGSGTIALATPVAVTHGGTGANWSSGDGMLRMTSGTSALYKWNFAAAVAPGVNDDIAQGYQIGSTWWDTTHGRIYGCVNHSIGAAVWQELSNTASGGDARPLVYNWMGL